MNETERLQELLDKKDEELEELQDKVRRFEHLEEREENRKTWVWTQHLILDKDDTPLPVPRLELNWAEADEHGYNRYCWYYLVYKHLLDEVIKVPMGMTKVGGSRGPLRPVATHGQLIDTPFRDTGHIVNDARQLKLPAYVVFEGHAQEIIVVGEKGVDREYGPLIEFNKAP